MLGASFSIQRAPRKELFYAWILYSRHTVGGAWCLQWASPVSCGSCFYQNCHWQCCRYAQEHACQVCPLLEEDFGQLKTFGQDLLDIVELDMRLYTSSIALPGGSLYVIQTKVGSLLKTILDPEIQSLIDDQTAYSEVTRWAIFLNH